jgi:hypothetical protein
MIVIQILYLIIDRVFVFKWFYFLKYQYSFIDYHKILITPNLHLTRKNNVKFKFYFKFLNKDIKFDDGVDWNFNKFGKLWNYNLQYLDYILDENVDLDYRRYLIHDISLLILNGKLKLEPYPVSIRIKNIILFDSIYDINDNVVIAALKRQIKYLSNNLEYHLLANHLLENYFTLFISSYSFSNYKLNSRISELLVYELDEQILEDGAHYERSPMYHSYILQRLNLCIDVIDNNGTIFDNIELRIFLANKARIMLGWLDLISFTNGKWPLINDSTENTSLSKTELESNFSKVNIYKQSINLKSSGFRKFQSGLGQIIMNIGAISPKYQPGHSHSDILSFYLSDGINQ